MKLVRFGAAGAEKPGLLDAQGVLRDASAWVQDWRGAALVPEKLRLWRERSLDELPVVAGEPRLGCPVAQVGKIVCVGLNYADHAAETGAAAPVEPVLFMKAVTAISGPNDDVQIPPGATKVDWEVELGGHWPPSHAGWRRGRSGACGWLCVGQRCVGACLADGAWRHLGQGKEP